MNISTLAILLLVHFSIFAQNNPEPVYAKGMDAPASRTAMARYAAHQSTDVTAARLNREAHLSVLLEQYQNAPLAQQGAIRNQLRQVLLEIMELKLEAQESDLRALKAELSQLNSSPLPGDQQSYLLELKARVDALQSRIDRRRKLTQDIVAKRLDTLLK